MHISDIVKTGVNILFPANCSFCKTEPSAHPFPICAKCKAAILSEETLPAISTAHLAKIWSCLPYDGIARECIKQFKYCGKRQMIYLFRNLIRNFLTDRTISIKSAELIVPVPIHRIRRLKRGYNQSESIARILSGQLHIPYSVNNLVKTKNTHPQIGLSKSERVKNLRNSFSVPRPSLLPKKPILLVDDVMTTGATLETCALELLRAGAGKVYGFTIARTP